jgi:hypothetical protein
VLSRLAGRHGDRAVSSVCETPTRPLLALLSQDGSRPRAPLRLLQVDVSTSTTTDHSSISIRGNPRSGRLPGLERKSPSVRGSRRSCSGSGVGPTEARRSRSRLLAPETSPQPRSLRAPGVARRHFPPVWSDAVRGWRCRRRAPLQGAPAGRVAWHRTSAKMPDVDQPEVPSITQAFASERTVLASRSWPCRSRRLFHHRRGTRGDAHVRSRWLDVSTARVANHPPSTRRSAPE